MKIPEAPKHWGVTEAEAWSQGYDSGYEAGFDRAIAYFQGLLNDRKRQMILMDGEITGLTEGLSALKTLKDN